MSEDELAIFRRRNLGIVYQFYNLIPTLTAEENIALPWKLDGRKENKERLSEIVNMLGLEKRAKHLPRQMSGGQQQRVSIGRALINEPVLGLNESINFFTGHSGSGKSTVIDAMQIVLYANTDGRGFFNKAAADDSDRSLIEYLRGMINIGENNQAEYKRNKNFSTTIVLEMEQTITKEKECIGVVFDVETATNEINRLFFWHKGELIPGDYRTKSRAMTISEVRSYLQQNFPKDEMFYTSNNERFRRNLYDVYLGGLDMEKFPRLFKRAIPFKMNIRLEDFVKEYICMEQDIHIEDMQEGAMLYGRMCRKIEATMQEIEELKQISAQYQAMEEKKKELLNCHYRMDKLTILQLEQTIEEMQHRVENWKKDVVLQNESLAELLEIKENYEKEYSEINEQIAGTGYARLEEQLKSLEENLSLLERSKNKWDGICARLNGWEDVDIVSNQILWDIEKFKEGTITGEEIERLKRSLIEVQKEAEKDRQEASARMFSRHLLHICCGTYPLCAHHHWLPRTAQT